MSHVGRRLALVLVVLGSFPPTPAPAAECPTKPPLTTSAFVAGGLFTLRGNGQGTVTTQPLPLPGQPMESTGEGEIEGNVYGLNLDLDLPGYLGGALFQSIPGPANVSAYISGGMHIFVGHFTGSYTVTPGTCQAGSVTVNYFAYTLTGVSLSGGAAFPFATGAGIVIGPCQRPICQPPA